MVLQGNGVEARVDLKHRRAAVLRVGIGRWQWESVVMRTGAATGEFEAYDGAEMLGEAELLDVRRPVVEPVVLGCGREFDVLGGEIDDAIVRTALVIAARRGVIVEIRAHPAGGVDQSLKAASHSRKFTGFHGDFALEMTVLNAARDDQSICARIQGHVKLPRLRVPLIYATVCAILRAEIGGFRTVEAAELHLARDGVAAGVSDV